MKTTFENRSTKTPSVSKGKPAPAVVPEVVQVIGIEPKKLRGEFNPFQVAWVVHPSRRDKRTGALTPGTMSEYRAQQLRDMLVQFDPCETCSGTGATTYFVKTYEDLQNPLTSLAHYHTGVCPTCKGVGV